MGARFRLQAASIPGIRSALGMDDPDVRKAYRRLYDAPLESLYVSRSTLAERARWRWASWSRWLESLPPFWTAFALTLTETVGATILALPIALASVGPLPGVAIIVVLGLINVLTIAFMAEAVARSGEIRQGNVYFGRIVRDYLGNAGSIVLSGSLFVLCFLILPVFYIGVATTLEDASPIGAPIWTVLLFAVGVYYLRRESLNATVSSALVIGAINIVLILSLCALALPEMRVDNLTYTNLPFVGGRAFEAAIITSIFGVVLAAYFGHTSVVLCGRLVLRRDPSGRSLMRGCVAAQLTAILLYGLFVVTVSGAVGHDGLSGESGTALAPLADRVGTLASGLGTVFVILGMGMGSIHFTLALFNVVRERLQFDTSRALVVPINRATLVLTRRQPLTRQRTLAISLVYRGSPRGRPAFDLAAVGGDTVYRERITIEKHWDLDEGDGDQLRAALPEAVGNGLSLLIAVDAANERSARLRVDTNMTLDLRHETSSGPAPSDLLSLNHEQTDLVSWLLREGEATSARIAVHLGREESELDGVLAPLLSTGALREDNSSGTRRYSAGLARRHVADLPDHVWTALGSEPPVAATERGRVRGRRFGTMLAGRTARFVVPATPILVAFVVTEWMLVTDSASFAGLLGFVGAIVVSLLAGVFPVLLVASSRHKGDYAASRLRILGHPVALVGIYLFFLAAILIHGAVIWDSPWERVGAAAACVVTIAVTAAMMRQGAFASRLTLEVRSDRTNNGRTRFRVTSGGRAIASDVSLEYPDGARDLRAAEAELPRFDALLRARFRPSAPEETPIHEIKVSTRAIGKEGENEPLAAIIEIHDGDVKRFDLRLEGGDIVVPLRAREWQIDLLFPD